MIKTITKVTACSIIAALLVTAYPAKEVKALTLPAAGIAATTGVGDSLKDIKASKARAKAKEASAKVHMRVSVSNEIALSSGTATTNTTANQNNAEVTAPVTPENVEKVDTPASIAFNADKEEMATGAKAATIEVTDNKELNDDGAVKVSTNSAKVISEQMEELNPEESSNTVTVSADAATPDILIKPEAAEVS